MPVAKVNGVGLYFEVTGEGFPLVFSHEYAGDFRSWEPQVRFFSRRYRVTTYNHRGYPPSEVLEDPNAYSPEITSQCEKFLRIEVVDLLLIALADRHGIHKIDSLFDRFKRIIYGEKDVLSSQ
jgi:pimeloyl-ACP methyl ester carboxylesterase